MTGWMFAGMELSSHDKLLVDLKSDGEIQIQIDQPTRRLLVTARNDGVETLRELHKKLAKVLADHDARLELPEVRHAG